MKEVEVSGKMKVVYNDDLIFRLVFLPKQEPDFESAKKAVQVLSEMSAEFPKRGTLIDARELVFLSSQIRQYFGAQKKDNLVALAILISSSVQKTLANLYMKFTKKATPTKVFSDHDEAVAWLKEQIKKA